MCNALEINVELTPPKDEDGNSRVEHYPSPYIDFPETYNILLFNNHYFINDISDLPAYSLEHYDEVKDIADGHLIYEQLISITIKTHLGKYVLKHFQYPNY